MAVGLLLGSGEAFAAEDEEKFFYFHKSDITPETFVGDFEYCGEYAARVQPPKAGYVYTPNLAAAGAAGFMQGIMKSGQRRMMIRAVQRKCMGMKGYTRYFMEEDRLDELWDGGWKDAKERVAALGSGPVPEDRVLPQ